LVSAFSRLVSNHATSSNQLSSAPSTTTKRTLSEILAVSPSPAVRDATDEYVDGARVLSLPQIISELKEKADEKKAKAESAKERKRNQLLKQLAALDRPVSDSQPKQRKRKNPPQGSKQKNVKRTKKDDNEAALVLSQLVQASAPANPSPVSPLPAAPAAANAPSSATTAAATVSRVRIKKKLVSPASAASSAASSASPAHATADIMDESN
jgi:hypothetical protein